MKIKQISVFIENMEGRLYEVIKLIGDNNINIRALSLADTSDFGILRLILDKPDKGYSILKDNNITVGSTEVVAVEVPDIPGGLATVLDALNKGCINVEYMYAFIERSGDCAIMIFRFDDIDKALQVLEKYDIVTITGEKLYKL